MDTLQGGLFGLTGKALAPAELPIDFYGEKLTKVICSYLSKPSEKNSQ